MADLKRSLKNIFWKLPLPGSLKEKMRVKYAERKFAAEAKAGDSFELSSSLSSEDVNDYATYSLGLPVRKDSSYVEYEDHGDVLNKGTRATLIAYYLTQFSPDSHNDLWWGKGTTEWNNVCKAVPQFVGHRQPRLPGELGFYDLRIKDVMRRQIEMARNYGVGVFSFYYYWFAGERILERPLNMFLEDKTLDMPFMFCWANENWTRRFSGTSDSVLIGMDNTVENYKNYIHEIMPYLGDSRYFKVDDKFALQIYRPSLIPEVSEVINYWRDEVKKKYNCDLYLIACQEADTDWVACGFDAENEWMQGSIKNVAREITSEVKPIRKDFSGEVFDYASVVTDRKFVITENRQRKVYPAIMPFWDNSARRNNRGTIWQNSTPELYKEWLSYLIDEVNSRKTSGSLDDSLIFINAWNEWGEGTYMEPDRDYGFAYLDATWQANREDSAND